MSCRWTPLALILLAAACSRPAPLSPITSKPLPARSAGDGPRFVKRDGAAIGLAFRNLLRPENIVAYLYMGAGVAVGDYDGDGLPDVYLVSQDGPNRLFRQVAPWRFEDVTAAAGGLDGGDAWGTAAAFADVDGDGDLDLFVCNLESPNLLYVNQGNGTFVERAGPFGLGTIAASTGVAFADYDNDGDLDLYLLTNRVLRLTLPPEIVAGITLPKDLRRTRAELFPPFPPLVRDGKPFVPEGYEDHFFTVPGAPAAFQAGQRDRLFRNDGYGRWVDITDEAGIRDQGNGLAVVWWDFDGDGWMDLYVANDFQSPDYLWRNRGDGTFEDVTAKMLPHTAFFGMGADFGDLDNDGDFDLLVADMSSTTHYMGKMLMGSMDQHRWFLMNAHPQQYMRNALYVNTGTGRFQEAAHLANLASTDWTWAVLFADLDEDGRLDCFVSNGIPVFTDNPDIGERFDRLWAAGRRNEALEVFRAIPPVAERNIARRNAGDLRFEDVGALWGLDEAGVAHGAMFCDLDRDGDLDLIVNNLNAPASVYENRSSEGHRVLIELVGTTSNRRGVGATIRLRAGGQTQVRQVSPTRGYMSAGEAVQHFGLGAATVIDELVVRWPSGREQRFANLSVDHHHTIVEPAAPAAVPPPRNAAAPLLLRPGPELPFVHRERDFDDYDEQPLLPHRLSRLGPGLASGDVDGDGRDELWLGGAAGQAGVLLRTDAAGNQQPVAGPWSDDAECEDMGACFVDFDGDGDLDLYVVSGGIEAGKRTELLRDRLYRNDGRGVFSRAADALPDLRSSGSCVVAADYDRDGDVDLFVGARVLPGRFPLAPPSVLLRNDGGRFVDASTSLPRADLGMVTAATWTDLDGDGFVDLIVAAQWQPLRVFGNDGGRAFVDRTAALGLHGVHGQWQSVAAGDLDDDGDVDLVAGNLGRNTKYKASADKPLRLYGLDYDGNGSFDVIEAKQSGDALLPVRGLSCSSQAMPVLREKFPTYDQFARASLAEIYGGETLASCFELLCHELQHVAIENRGGALAMMPLPWRSQIAPVFGIGVVDIDADGRQDLVLAQNFYSPEPETGRFAGGLGQVLRGLGGMQFDCVEPAVSGLVMPEDAKALAVIVAPDQQVPLLVCATNDGPVRTFVPSGGGMTAPWLGVRLRGDAGNPSALGARVELIVDGRAVAARELAAGAGYLAQSSPIAWFARVADGAQVRVRWPDGGSSEHALQRTHGIVTVAR